LQNLPFLLGVERERDMLRRGVSGKLCFRMKYDFFAKRFASKEQLINGVVRSRDNEIIVVWTYSFLVSVTSYYYTNNNKIYE
jgi:hypothetical protein